MGKQILGKIISGMIAGILLSALISLVTLLNGDGSMGFSALFTLNVLLVVPIFLVAGIALSFVIEHFAVTFKSMMWSYGIVGAVIAMVLYTLIVRGNWEGLVYYATTGVIAALVFYLVQQGIMPMLDRLGVASALQDEAREEYARNNPDKKSRFRK
ncbi:hypothetical protein BN1050_00537 [Metalysinibacillus saudimassiliensis]|uniref:Uncharacterized protein n=1 Tax=Metalysinibacillus saudimassiliensis TaxID=1461583 RepID=A0A078LYR6_9BACL|nr:hypothetical protein BN1050_00537 [Metalysinibacillus saudimassiliensis]